MIENLSSIFRQFGCSCLEDYLMITHNITCKNYLTDTNLNDTAIDKFNIIRKNLQIIKITLEEWEKNNDGREIGTKEFNKLSLVNDSELVLYANNLECFDLSRIMQSFYLRVYGIRIVLHQPELKQTLIIDGIMNDNVSELIENNYVNKKIEAIKKYIAENNKDDNNNCFVNNFCDSLLLKEFLIYSVEELFIKFNRYMLRSNKLNQEPVADVVSEFCNEDLFNKRLKLIQLLIKYEKVEFQYLAYLLYDLLGSEVNTAIESNEQNLIFDSFPWAIKKYFKAAMKQTIDYTTKLCNYEVNVPLEQQICLMKASENIKQKAMLKLREVKSKADETGSKARQWLEGLLKIPFGVLKEEPMLKKYNEIKEEYQELTETELDENINLLKIKNNVEIIEKDCDIKNNHRVYEIKNKIISLKKESHLSI